MKKVLSLLLTIALLFILTGCNKQQKTELQTIINTKIQNENIYTTDSYQNYTNALKKAKNAQEETFITTNKLTQAQKNLQSAIDNLVVATKGIYRIEYNFIKQSNNHVGNEWQKFVLYNGQTINNNDTVIVPLNSSITIDIIIIENDIIPDIGKGNMVLLLTDKTKRTTQVTIEENCGKYRHNIAIWNVECFVELVERV